MAQGGSMRVAVLLGCCAASGMAAAAADTPVTRSGIDEVIVTAQHREQSAHEVPLAVQAFSREEIERRGIDDIGELPALTPGLTLSNEAGFALSYLRGIGTDAFILADASVATLVDGVYYPFQLGLLQDLGAIERIEVLKGPQSALFTRNAVGGAIRIVTPPPAFAEAGGELQLRYGQYGEARLRSHLNLPLQEGLAASVSALLAGGEHYMSGRAGDAPLPRERSRGARVKLRWQPLPALDLQLAALRLSQQGIGSYFALNAEPRPLGAVAGIRPQPGYRGEVDNPSYFELHNTVLQAQAQWTVRELQARLLASRQRLQISGSYDFDGSPVPLIVFAPERHIGAANSIDLQLSGALDAAYAPLQWLAGVSYFDSRRGYERLDLRFAGIDLDAGVAAGLTLPAPLRDALRAVDAASPLMLPTGQIELQGIVMTRAWSAYAQLEYRLAPSWVLTLAAQARDETLRVERSSTQVELANGGRAPLFDFARERPNAPLQTLKPRLALQWQPDADRQIYLSWQQALKSAAFNAVNLYDPVDYVRPERHEVTELGFKWRDGASRLTLSAAVFETRIRDLQVQYVSATAGGTIQVENAAATRVRGVDGELSWVLWPQQLDGLLLSLGGCWLDAEYTRYPDGTGFDEQSGLLVRNRDFSGQRAVRAPRFSGTLGLSHTTILDENPLLLALQLYLNSGYSFAPPDDAISNQPAYQRLDAQLSYEYRRWQLRTTLYARNLNDRFYVNGVFNTDFGRLQSPAAPRVIGLQLDWRF